MPISAPASATPATASTARSSGAPTRPKSAASRAGGEVPGRGKAPRLRHPGTLRARFMTRVFRAGGVGRCRAFGGCLTSSEAADVDSRRRAQLARAATPFATCLTDAEWALAELSLPATPRRGRPRRWPMRLLLDAMLCVLRTGCAWPGRRRPSVSRSSGARPASAASPCSRAGGVWNGPSPGPAAATASPATTRPQPAPLSPSSSAPPPWSSSGDWSDRYDAGSGLRRKPGILIGPVS